MHFAHTLIATFVLLGAGPLTAQEVVTIPLEDLLIDLTASPETQETTEAPQVAVMAGLGAELRVLDKLTGVVADVNLQQGETVELGFMSVSLIECRYPVDNPFGDAFTYLQVQDRKKNTTLFSGWMLASAPALNAMDHPRYDVWALRCITS